MKWISVKDRLPKIRKPVLIYVEYGKIATAYCNNYINKTWGWTDWMRGHHSYGSVTHWMPLPDPPKKSMEGSK